MKSKLLIVSSILASIMVGGLSFAQESAQKPTAAAETKMGVGNKICPITGEKIIAGKESKVEYNGKIYTLCCAMCKKDFLKDPEAAIKKLSMMEQEKMGGKEEANDMDNDDMPGMDDKSMNAQVPVPGVGN